MQVFLLPENDIEQNLDDRYAPFILESFVRGKEFSAEGICLHGKVYIACFTEKVLKEDSFYEIGHKAPYHFEQNEDTIKILITHSLHALDPVWEFFHLEFWQREDGFLSLGRYIIVQEVSL